MELAAFLWALGDLPLAMAGSGAVALGPQPWLLLPLGPLQVFVGAGEPPVAVRIHVLRGPWFGWTDLPPPRVAVGRAVRPAWLTLVRGQAALSLAWELMASPSLSLMGTVGDEASCGLRLKRACLWAAALIRQGGLSLWCGLYFSF